MLRIGTVFFLFFLVLSSNALAEGPKYYDEIFDKSGNIRPHYAEVYAIYKGMSEKEKKDFLKLSRKDFQGDNALAPLPRLILESEYEELRAGAEQRATALRLFLQDHYSGKKSYLNTVIPEEVMNRILARTGEGAYEGLIDPKNIAFPLGLDTMRDAQGKMRVIEDNPGFIGGPGDLKIARESLFLRKPEYQDVLAPQDDPEKYYRDLAERYRQLASPKNGKIVIFAVPPYPDKEDSRLNKIFKDLGIEVITPNTKNKLVITDQGAFVESPSPSGGKLRKRIGYLVLNGEHPEVDWVNPVTMKRALISAAEDLLGKRGLDKESRKRIKEALQREQIDLKELKSAIYAANLPNEYQKGLKTRNKPIVEAILSGKLATNYSPGIDFIGDKEFYIYVEDLIRHYLNGQEPILKNIETHRFAKVVNGQVVLDKKKMEKVFGERKENVIKPVDGRGGDGVRVGAKIPKKEFDKAKPLILDKPLDYIAQKFTHLSVLAGNIVDARVLMAVDRLGAYVSPTLWGRALPINGNGLVNLSATGMETAMIVVKDPVVCDKAFRSVARK